MITLIGHGYIGQQIAKTLLINELIYTWIRHTDSIPSNTSFIINAGGYTGTPNVDACEKLKDECADGNVLFPVRLEQQSNVPILHISSGCVYTGYDKEYTEEDEPNFTFSNASFYSGCKAIAQQLLMPYMERSYLFRIRMPFGPERNPKNLLTKLETYSKLINYENSITHIEYLANTVVFFVKNRPEAGIYNICNHGGTTTKEIVASIGLEKEWMTVEEFNSITTAPRSNCVLSTKKIAKIYNGIRDVEQALEENGKLYK